MLKPVLPPLNLSRPITANNEENNVIKLPINL